MRLRQTSMAAIASLALVASNAEVIVTTDHQADRSEFQLQKVPPPAINDAGTAAEFSLVDGERDLNGGDLSVLHDGKLPTEEDQPAANFFFRSAAEGGRLQIDLGQVIAVKEVNSYSWHGGSRAPQVYTLWGAAGTGDHFKPKPTRGTDPASCGWTLLTKVDTRPANGEGGGQYGVSVVNSAGVLGDFRYLLFDVVPTETRDPFGHTFFSEIDVIDAHGPKPVPVTPASQTKITKSFDAGEGRFHFTMDATAAPDLMEWADAKLRPVIQEWYPKLVAMLPSDGFNAATNITLLFRNDMRGTPASAGGSRVNLNSTWFRKELDREARGSVVHELVHVVQNYGRARRTNPNATRTPGWIVEGIPDYIRWFLYEPETKGAEITERNLQRARYDASYRVTGNFLNWVVQTYDKDLIRKLNTAAREGRYSPQLWEDWTGKKLSDLGVEWKEAQARKIKG